MSQSESTPNGLLETQFLLWLVLGSAKAFLFAFMKCVYILVNTGGKL